MAPSVGKSGLMGSLTEAVTGALSADQVFRAANSPKFGRASPKTTQDSIKRRMLNLQSGNLTGLLMLLF